MKEIIEKNFRTYFLLALLALATLVWYAVWTESGSNLTVAFLDVGQGDAIFVEAPNGNQILFDGGPDKSVLAELSRVMPFYDRSINAIILSHPNQDHIAGLVEAMKRFEVESAIEPGTEHPIAEYEEWRSLIEEKNIARVFGARGMRVWLDERQGIYMDILSPEEGESLTGKNVNDVMLVGRLVYGDTEVLLTGDMERPLEYRLVAGGAPLFSDLLKVGHHGSRTSSSDYFLKSVNPKYAVIQVGNNNRYGHPNQEVLTRLKDAGVKIFRTDTDGAIIFKSDGRNLTLKK